MKKLVMMAMMIAASVGLTNAQTAQRQVVEEMPPVLASRSIVPRT